MTKGARSTERECGSLPWSFFTTIRRGRRRGDRGYARSTAANVQLLDPTNFGHYPTKWTAVSLPRGYVTQSTPLPSHSQRGPLARRCGLGRKARHRSGVRTSGSRGKGCNLTPPKPGKLVPPVIGSRRWANSRAITSTSTSWRVGEWIPCRTPTELRPCHPPDFNHSGHHAGHDDHRVRVLLCRARERLCGHADFGVVLLGLWRRQHATSKRTVEAIKNGDHRQGEFRIPRVSEPSTSVEIAGRPPPVRRVWPERSTGRGTGLRRQRDRTVRGVAWDTQEGPP